MKRFVLAAAAIAFALFGCKSLTETKRDFTPTAANFFIETVEPEAASVELPVSGVRIAIGSKPVFTEGDLVGVELMQVDFGKCLMFQLSPAASRELYRLSGSNQGRRLVLMLNQKPMGARRIEAPLGEGHILMFVEVPETALPVLVTNLRETADELQRALAKR